MATDDMKTLVEDTLKKHRGPFGIVAFMVSLSVLVLKLPPDYIARLRETWFIIAVPSALALLGSIGQAYLIEQKNRTKVEVQISNKLETLADYFKQSFDNNLENKIFLDRSFDMVVDGQRQIIERTERVYKVLEKRADHPVVHSGDTEKFLYKEKTT